MRTESQISRSDVLDGQVTLKIRREDLERIAALAQAAGVSRSTMVRRLLARGLDGEGA